eukprot:SAG11_NODE_4503_length_1872_cov_7.648054_4_plen_67_part_01
MLWGNNSPPVYAHIQGFLLYSKIPCICAYIGFFAKARYVEPEFRVSNLLEQLADPVRKSIEVHFEAL